MQNSYKYLLRNLHKHQVFFKENSLLNYLTEDDVEELKNLSLLKQGADLQEIICPSCDEGHFTPVRAKNDEIFTFCSCADSSRNVLKPSEIRTWTFNIELFLQQMAHKLGINEQIEKLSISGMWQIGGFSKDDTYHTCYFFHGKSFEEAIKFIKKQPSLMRRYVIIVNRQEFTSLEGEHELLCIEAEHLVELKGRGLKFSKQTFDEYLTSGFRSVYFNLKNGDLLVNGEIITTITPSSAEYYFAELLWNRFNEPQSHRNLKNYIYEKNRQDYEDIEGKLCHKMKLKIKKKAKKPELINAIFKSMKNLDGENSYIMKNPA